MCQFKCVTTIEQMTSRRVYLIESTRKNLKINKRRYNKLKNYIFYKKNPLINQNDTKEHKNDLIKSGDTVRILPKEK